MLMSNCYHLRFFLIHRFINSLIQKEFLRTCLINEIKDIYLSTKART